MGIKAHFKTCAEPLASPSRILVGSLKTTVLVSAFFFLFPLGSDFEVERKTDGMPPFVTAMAASTARIHKRGNYHKSFVDFSNSNGSSGSDDEARPSHFSSDDLCITTLRNCLAQWHVSREEGLLDNVVGQNLFELELSLSQSIFFVKKGNIPYL